MNFDLNIHALLNFMQNIQPAPAAIPLDGVGRIGDMLQFLQNKLRNDENAFKKAGFRNIGNAPVNDELYFYQHQYSKIVYSYFTSLYLQEIGDIIPDKIDVTVYQGYKFNNMPNNFKVHYVKPELYELGIIEFDTIFGNKVKVYSLERTFCDFIYNNQAIDQEAYINFIKYYANYKSKDLKELYSIAKQMGITKKVQDIMELINN